MRPRPVCLAAPAGPREASSPAPGLPSGTGRPSRGLKPSARFAQRHRQAPERPQPQRPVCPAAPAGPREASNHVPGLPGGTGRPPRGLKPSARFVWRHRQALDGTGAGGRSVATPRRCRTSHARRAMASREPRAPRPIVAARSSAGCGRGPFPRRRLPQFSWRARARGWLPLTPYAKNLVEALPRAQSGRPAVSWQRAKGARPPS